jgi:hypothetical protein
VTLRELGLAAWALLLARVLQVTGAIVEAHRERAELRRWR